ncbi:MAG TPA: hypothetical protein VJL90_08875 [Pseudorhodoplanes sp.]|nr:hypothetical protein [Pseudorhodoplanes sp.]
MRLGTAAAMVLLLTGAAHAAQWNTLWRQEKYCPPDRKQNFCDPDRVQKQREIDEAYRDAIQHYPLQKPVASDPWGGVRAGEGTPGKGAKKKR